MYYPDDLSKIIVKNKLLGIWKLMDGFHLTYVVANLSLGLSAIFKTSTFLLLRYFADHVIGSDTARQVLPWVALGFIALATLEGACTYTSGRLAAFTAEGITQKVRDFLYDHIQRLTLAYHSQAKTGDLIERATSDVDALRRFFSEQAIGVGRIIFLFTVNFVAVLYLNAFLALISIIAVPFILSTSIFFFRKVTKAYEAYQEQESVLTTTLQENLSGVRVVKAFARQDYERTKFDRENWQKFLLGRRLASMHALFWPASDIICGVQMLIGLAIAAVMAINGTITVGTYVAYAGLVAWLIWPLRNLGRLIVQTSTGLVSFSRVLTIIQEQREPLDQGDYQPQQPLRGELVFDGVCFEYDDDETSALIDISFAAKPGQTIALLGSTGSGKTTLVNLLPRFYEYTRGSIKLDGVELTRYSRKFLRSQVGVVEQEPFLFSRTIRENLLYGVGEKVDQNEIEAAARAAAIHEGILAFPEGYDTLVGERGVTLSGGQMQRITIARTITRQPRILILDDSTSSVDFETESEIRTALENLMLGRTTFIIAHRIQSVMNADQILVMDKGRIVQQGTHSQLLEEEGIYRQIFDIQMRIEGELKQEIAMSEDPVSEEPMLSASLD
ncbi:MAG: ABC transporter [Anaerolineae bacterium UTCFX2]|jgi:ATP-binding cassette subfamily B protein|nr:ABC transporter ATP-binding protein [Anaerolineae bacterium]MCZ7553854.1 ABC transporter ATP-binding protein/permease [Anaerolineales bacterium]OQY93163.1 MAG: ABC transporter [Anaerolineae bacterium UTCFX2]